MKRKAEAQGGFSLLELLVGLALMAFIATMMASSLRLTSQTVRRIDEQSFVFEAASRQQYLIGLLEKASLQANASTQSADELAPFAGRGGSLSFSATLPAWLQRSGQAAMRLSLSERRENGLAHLQVQLEEGLFEDPSDAIHTIIENVEGISLRYFGALKGEVKADWHDEWLAQERLPQMIEVIVMFPAGDKRVWPKTIVRLSSL